MKKTIPSKENKRFYEAVARSVQRAARRARETARMHRTPIYVWENGRVVARRP
jgi:hypothetical protein